MKIRSITCYLDPRHDPDGIQVRRMAEFCSDAREQLAARSVEVQSTRISTPPFPLLLQSQELAASGDLVLTFSKTAEASGFGYISCGPSLPEFPSSQDQVYDLLRLAPNVFFGAIIGDQEQVYPRALRAAARTIKAASTITPDGFANLRFAALANTRPYGPFFPGSYAVPNEKPAFSLAVECADAVLAAFKSDRPLEDQRRALVASLEAFSVRVGSLLQPLADEYTIEFKGFDFSPAPFPEPDCSLGASIEALGVTLVRSGALAAAAVIADTLSRGSWKHAGYNGLMLPVLEDSVLAQRAAEGRLHIQDLLLFSAVCGTGLDTVPLPGNVSTEEIESILWDMAALAVRLGKPLTARLMPIPGKKAGDPTEFDFGYFQNSRVMAVEGQQVQGPLNSDAPVKFSPRLPNGHN